LNYEKFDLLALQQILKIFYAKGLLDFLVLLVQISSYAAIVRKPYEIKVIGRMIIIRCKDSAEELELLGLRF
jgi:hypothetical protein